jgi:hypothetical protein
MIFHTAADSVYYKSFYDYYSYSIKKYFNNSKLSLHFIGNSTPVNPLINYSTNHNISFDKIKEKYNVDDINAKGFYALSRWLSIPNKNNNVVVSDVDIIALKYLPENNINNLLENYEVINITRTKKNGSEGGMAMMIIRQDVINEINKKAKDVLNNHKLQWDSDVQVRSFIYNNYNVAHLPEMHVFGKKSNYKNFDNTKRSFAICKGRIDAKCNSLKKALLYL